ncbi:uncharacterized protein LOC123013009 [Tribolium madens]|uniref:uncharacterized protein LOC123013009 n=1 Tax=Tribolium madens TaxID=41895 RepID=UPI001CF7674D|nr:uncharacterized protein LOC123013009 [Tribolium madens]
MYVKVITTKQPSYLEALLQENCNLKLVFKEKKAESPHIISGEETEIHELSDFDLTGDPLKTDLGGDDIIEDIILTKPTNWSSEEAQQYPLALSEARTFINNQLRLKSRNESIYCICDGSDAKKTVGLGTVVTPKKIVRTLVHVLPCCYDNNSEQTIDHLKNEFLKSLKNANANVKTFIKKSYNLFGYNLENCHSFQNVEYNGNITIDVSTFMDSKSSKNNTVSKMNFQVIIGHNNSRINRLYQELCLVQSYITLLQDTQRVNDNTIINSEHDMDPSDINSIILDFIHAQKSYGGRSFTNLDLENLRQTNILDKLWDSLKHCKTVGDLCHCFQFFFEEFETGVQTVEESDCTLAELVNGRIIVSSLSLPQCVELLIELGLIKLKNDYLAIITSFYPFAKDSLLKMWNDLKAETNVNTDLQRKSRISVNTKSVIADMTSNKLKLFYLDSLHKVSELMLLYKDNLSILEEYFDTFCEAVCKRFIDKFEKVVVWTDLKQLRVCHFSDVVSSTGDQLFLQNNSPITFAVKMSSKVDSEEIIVVHHFSEFLILPPCVYDNYEINCDEKDVKTLYVTKLVGYIDHY